MQVTDRDGAWTPAPARLFERWLNQYHPEIELLGIEYTGAEVVGITLKHPDDHTTADTGEILDEFEALLYGDCVICRSFPAAYCMSHVLDNTLYAGLCTSCATDRGEHADHTLALVVNFDCDQMLTTVRPELPTKPPTPYLN